MKKLGIAFIILFGLIGIGILSTSSGNEQNIEPKAVVAPYSIGKVTATSLKIRCGLSTENDYIGLLAKDELVHIYGKVDNWYIVKTENNLVGAVSSDYIESNYEAETTIETSANIETANQNSIPILSQDEQIFLNLINNKRIANNLPEFQIDEPLLNLARLKANDMLENKYFSHTSPKLGTLFEMLTNHQISYSKASENIAKNLNADSAIESLIKSEPHKKNILSENFNYTGIAVVNSIDYGKLFVQIFVAK